MPQLGEKMLREITRLELDLTRSGWMLEDSARAFLSHHPDLAPRDLVDWWGRQAAKRLEVAAVSGKIPGAREFI